MLPPIPSAILGGVLIGVAAGALLVLNGRIAGISGVLAGLVAPSRETIAWRAALVAGLVVGGVGLSLFYPTAFAARIDTPLAQLLVAGLLVGFGTQLGSGCTSGHGVCGVARLSPRSLVATAVFIASGVATVWVRHLVGAMP